MSTFNHIVAFFTQLALLTTCTFLLGVLKPHLRSMNARVSDIGEGSLFGLFAVLLMLNPIQVADGVIFDLRNVIIAVAGSLGGVIPAGIGSVIVIGYRLLLGGAGVPVAVGSALTSAALGVVFYIYRRRFTPRINRWHIVLGVVVGLQTIGWLRLLPTTSAQAIIAAIGLPILISYPVSSWLFGFLLCYQERHTELKAALSAERNMLRTLIDNVPDYIFVKDRTRRYLISNLAHARAAGVAHPADLIGKTAAAFFPPDYVTFHDDDDEAVLRGERLVAQERQTVNEAGALIWVSTTKIPLQDAQGRVTGIVGISRNITERKQAEEALRDERNLLRTLFDAVPANIYIKDAQSRFVDANVETMGKLGVNIVQDLVGKSDFDFFPADLAAKYFADEQTVLQSGQPLLNVEEPTFDHRTRAKLWFLTTKAPLHNEQGEVTGLVGVGLDITDRRQAAQTLQAKHEEERQFQRSLEALSAISVELTQIDELDQFYRRVVELALERLGFDRFGLLLYDAEHATVIGTYGTDANGQVMSEHALRLDPASLTGILNRTLKATDRFLIDDHAQLFSNLEPIGFGWNAAAMLWNGEESLGWITADNGVQHQPVSKPLLDILALYAQTVGTLLGRKRVDEALREHEAKLQMFFEVLPVGAAVLNHDGQIVEMNPALARILDLSGDEILTGAHRSRKYIFNDGTPMPPSAFPSARAYAEQKTIHDSEVGIIKADETIVWTSVSAAPLPGVDSGVITVTMDITERKQAQEQAFVLAAERQRVKLLSQFIVDVSHDFRTPLTVIGTSASLIGKIMDPVKLEQRVERIMDQVFRLTLLLDSFVELAHLEQAAVSPQFQPIALETELKTLVERHLPTLANKHQHFEYHCKTPSLQVWGDARALAKVVSQLVDNAIRHTPDDGRITLSLSKQAEQAVIEVADTGTGIQAEDLPHIFESFYRAGSARSTESGGAGLGLSIAKKIVELMGGRITVQSEWDQGSVFSICLPLYH